MMSFTDFIEWKKKSPDDNQNRLSFSEWKVNELMVMIFFFNLRKNPWNGYTEIDIFFKDNTNNKSLSKV